MNKKVYETFVNVRYADTDQMGVVYYANYYIWMEVGRTDLLKQVGITYKSLEAQGIFLPVSESHCRYLYPARYDDNILIKTWIEKVRNASLKIEYEIYNKDNNMKLAQGYTIHPFIDSDGNIKEVPDFLREALE